MFLENNVKYQKGGMLDKKNFVVWKRPPGCCLLALVYFTVTNDVHVW